VEFCDLKAQYAALEGEILARMKRVLDHGRYVMGPEVGELEAALAARVGVRHAVTVASGTDALLIALMALDLQPGDEVITSPFTFAATAEAIVLAGGVPVFVDVEADTALIDARLIEAAITPRTRVLMPVSLYGQCADMAAIELIARRHALASIEDAAQSFGAAFDGRASGSFGAFGATSFFPSKPLGCYGDGGALFTDDDALAQAAREIRVHGQRERYRHVRIGVGGRMDTLQCAVLLAKLPRFDWELAQRREIAARYDDAFAGLSALRPTALCAGRTSVHAQYTLRVDAPEDEGRDALAADLHAQGIPSAIHYPMPLHHQRAYAGYAQANACPVAARLSRQVLSLPMSADLAADDQARVIDAVPAWATGR
jgi:UDP-2-acetamido-2-deoxy-ribo-hexuluronate aminotransferase